MEAKIKKTILKQTIIPIILVGVLSIGVTTFLISNYITEKFFSDRYRIIELVVDRAVSIADFNGRSLQEFETLGMNVPEALKSKVKLNAINSIASFAGNFKRNNVNIVIVEDGKPVFKNTEKTAREAPPDKIINDKTVSWGGRTYISYSAAFPQWKWVIYGLSDKKIFMSPLYKIRYITAASFTAVIILLLLYVTFIFKNRIYGPLHQLMDNAAQITSGDLNRIAIRAASAEFAVLAESFNGMIDSLNKALKARDDYAKELVETNTELERLNLELESIVEKRTLELKEAYEKLKERDKVKTDFLSMVSHDLRTPMNAVLGFTELIKMSLDEFVSPALRPGDEKVQAAMRQISKNLDIISLEGSRLLDLINDCLDIARLEEGEIEWRMETVRIEEIIGQAIAGTSSLIEQKGLRLIEDIEDGLPELTADRNRLVQVMVNLISNAVKFTDTGSVTLGARRACNEIRVSVIDTGIGIAGENHGKVFDRFKQIGEVQLNRPKGTGLGLSICKQIVEYHGGRIWVESEPGKGSNFSFILPALS